MQPLAETLLHHYHPPQGVYDELGRGAVPTHWLPVMNHFNATHAGMEATAPEDLRSEMLVRDLDVQRPTRLDAIPFILATSDWQHLQQGLEQRATLLNALTADIYGTRSLLQPEGLPPALVFGNARYLLSACDYQPQGEEFLQLLAFDVGRSPDGRWRVLADWTEAPAGLGMCLENRILSAQSLPQTFRETGTERLRPFYAAHAQHMSSLAEQTTPDGITVVLCQGPSHPYYFEQTYLGQYFGFPVVEGADLTVRGQTLYLKTLEGLKPVGCVIRHTPAQLCDQLYLDSITEDGVPGITRVARAGRVHIANALGSGAVENDAFMSFLPGLSQRLLGEDLLMPNLATWWCGQASEAEFVADHMSELHVGSAFNRPELFAANVLGFQAAGIHPDVQFQSPHDQIGRELIQLSHAPYLNEFEQIASGPVLLRLFVAMTDNGYRLMPGGIARVATSHGEVSKDLWVNTDASQELPSPGRVQAHHIRRSDRDLPSRTADDLFWLGRYLERCEGAVRAYRCLFSHVTESSGEEQAQVIHTVTKLLVDLDMLTPQQARQLTGTNKTPLLAREWWSILFEPNSSAGLDSLLQNIYRLANQVRERLSGDAWRLFNHLVQIPAQQRFQLTNVGDALLLMDQLIHDLSGLNGQIQENMTRGYGWRLLELGRRLERGQFALQVMQELVSNDSSTTYFYLLLDLLDSTITYRSRYQNTPDLENLLHLLLLDESNPRSVVYQVQRLQDVMAEMPLEQNEESLSNAQRVLLIGYHELVLAEPNRMVNVISTAGNRTQLRRVLNRLRDTLRSLSELVTATYFAHAHAPTDKP